jgi:hypothetical protein
MEIDVHFASKPINFSDYFPGEIHGNPYKSMEIREFAVEDFHVFPEINCGKGMDIVVRAMDYPKSYNMSDGSGRVLLF